MSASRQHPDHSREDRNRVPSELRENPRLYEDLPSVTNRQWGAGSPDDGFGYPGQGGYGDFSSNQPRKSYRGIGPRSTRGDAAIQEAINERLMHDDEVDAGEMTVLVNDGVATLSGTVPTRYMKHRAEDLAATCRGVRDVENHVRVTRGEESFGPAGRAVRSGYDQQGSGFSSSERTEISETRLGSTGAEGTPDIPRPGRG